MTRTIAVSRLALWMALGAPLLLWSASGRRQLRGSVHPPPQLPQERSREGKSTFQQVLDHLLWTRVAVVGEDTIIQAPENNENRGGKKSLPTQDGTDSSSSDASGRDDPYKYVVSINPQQQQRRSIQYSIRPMRETLRRHHVSPTKKDERSRGRESSDSDEEDQRRVRREQPGRGTFVSTSLDDPRSIGLRNRHCEIFQYSPQEGLYLCLRYSSAWA